MNSTHHGYKVHVRAESANLADDLERSIVSMLVGKLGLHKGLAMVAVGVSVRQLGKGLLDDMGWSIGPVEGPVDPLPWKLAGNRLIARGLRLTADDKRVQVAAKFVVATGQSAARKVLSVTRWG